MAQMKEKNKTPGKQLNETEITSLSDAEFKSLVMTMLKELTKQGKSIKKPHEEIRVTLSEIKKNPQGTNNEGKELRIQINGLEHKEEEINS